MGKPLPINFSIGAFPIGFRGNCQDFANALVERLTGTVDTGTPGFFVAQFGGPTPHNDLGGPFWSEDYMGFSMQYWDAATGQYQPAEDQLPIGACILYGGGGVPSRFLYCNGQTLVIAQYPRLYQRIGAIWGGDGSSTFALPPGGRYLYATGHDPVNNLNVGVGVGGTPRQVQINPMHLPPVAAKLWQSGGHWAAGDDGGVLMLGYQGAQPNANPGYSDGLVDGDGRAPTNELLQLPMETFMSLNLCIRYC